MRFKERNDLANRCKEWMKDQLENNITTPLDTVHMVLAYLDANKYLNEVVRCKDCKFRGKLNSDGWILCLHWSDEEYEHWVRGKDYCSRGKPRTFKDSLYHGGKTIYCDGFETCEDCPRYADDCDGDPDKMGEEE